MENGPSLTENGSRAVVQTRATQHTYHKLRHANPEHEKYVVVNWCFGNVCNYQCSYCPSELHDGSTPWVDLDLAQRFIAKVFDHYGPERSYFFEFTGGEVTLYKDFLPLCEFIKARGGRVGIISNGSRSLAFWEKALPLLDQVCLSFHPESANAEHFRSVVEFLAGSLRVHVNMMMTPEHFDSCYILAVRLKDIGNISMALQPLMKDFGDQLYPYTPVQRQILEKQNEMILKHIRHTRSFETYRGTMMAVGPDGQQEEVPVQKFIANGTNNWLGWDCAIGLEQFVIRQDGTLMRGWCGVGGDIGNFKDANLNLPKTSVRCTKSFCHCNFDIMCTKEKPRE